MRRIYWNNTTVSLEKGSECHRLICSVEMKLSARINYPIKQQLSFTDFKESLIRNFFFEKREKNSSFLWSSRYFVVTLYCLFHIDFFITFFEKDVYFRSYLFPPVPKLFRHAHTQQNIIILTVVALKCTYIWGEKSYFFFRK